MADGGKLYKDAARVFASARRPNCFTARLRRRFVCFVLFFGFFFLPNGRKRSVAAEPSRFGRGRRPTHRKRLLHRVPDRPQPLHQSKAQNLWQVYEKADEMRQIFHAQRSVAPSAITHRPPGECTRLPPWHWHL